MGLRSKVYHPARACWPARTTRVGRGCEIPTFAAIFGQSSEILERIALSLARPRVTQGRGDEIRDVLHPVYDRFVQGFEASDLRIARAMIDSPLS